jgi:mono/diheme cytochrome c family protein
MQREYIPEYLPKYFVLTALTAGFGHNGLATREANLLRRRWGTVNVMEPELSAIARAGKTEFEANCVPCHGLKAAGTDKGPSLVHDIYQPGTPRRWSVLSGGQARRTATPLALR